MVLSVSLLMIAVSSYSSFTWRNEQQIIVDELRHVMQYAKLQAMVRGYPVFLRPLAASLDWSQGMSLNFMNKKTHEAELIYQWQWSHPHWDLHWVGVYSNKELVFSNNPIQAMSNGHFILFNKHTHEQMTLISNRLGRIRVINRTSPRA